MKPEKTKLSYPLSLSEAKRHLRVDEDYHDDDDYILNTIYAATQVAENYIGKDIAETENEHTIYDFVGEWVKLEEGNFIEFTQGVTDSSTLVTVEEVHKQLNFTLIKFTQSISSDPLTLTYVTGYEEGECPEVIKQAILIKIADLYDINRQSYSSGSLKPNQAFDNLLNSYRYITF